VFVADFGVARAITEAGDEQLTATGSAVGTPAYMAPEQAAGGSVDARTDVYALGCVLYEMLAGEPPFTGRTPQAIMAKCIARQAPPLRTIRPSVPDALEEVIQKALEPAPADRFGTVAELSSGLDRLSSPSVSAARPLPGHVTLGSARRRILAGAMLTLGIAAVIAAGDLGVRALGIGRTPTLLATGVLAQRERLLIADFESHAADSLLGLAATEAFRTDLSQSSAVTTVPTAQVAQALSRMRRPAGSRLDPALARELAVREGIKAVVTGEIGPVANAYLISVELVSAKSGEVLVAQRETAPDAAGIIPAIDRLSRRLRERIGESLHRVRAERPLESVTTPSLAALLKYSLATRLGMGNGDFRGAIPLLEEAVALDTGFAMAWRTLGVYRGQVGDRAGLIEALSKAFQHGDRLTEREAAHTRAAYFDMVTGEPDKAIASYRAILEQDPTDRTALINLALQYAQRRDYASAESLDTRAIALDSSNWIPYLNLIYAQVAGGKRSDAESTLARALAKMPGLPAAEFDAIDLAASGGDYGTAVPLARSFEQRYRKDPRWGPVARRSLASLALVRGKLAEAEAHLSEAMAASEAAEDTSSYLDLALDRAMIDIGVRGRRARGLRQIERALTKFPMQSLEPPSRPYLALAEAYAKLLQPARARGLVAQYDSTVDPLMRLDLGAQYLRHSALGEIALAERHPAVAVAEFRQSQVCPTCGIAAMAQSYDALGRMDSAIAVYERYLATPDISRLTDDAERLARTYRRLGDLYALRGDRNKAREYYTRFVELWKDSDSDLQAQVAEVRRRLVKLGPAASG